MKKEFDILLTAIMFYTRIPVPGNMGCSNEMLNKSTRYLPLIGILVGGIGWFIWWLTRMIFPYPLAILFSMVTTILITGALHEDGFADFCDGFGGSPDKVRILEIMKDSRLGTFGAMALFLMLLTKFSGLSNIKEEYFPFVLISSHAFSRFLPVCMINTSVYVRKDGTGKSEGIGHKGSTSTFLISLFFGLCTFIFLPWQSILMIVTISFLLFILFRKYCLYKIGGYTGDVLGALQQLIEITFYLGFLVFQHYIPS